MIQNIRIAGGSGAGCPSVRALVVADFLAVHRVVLISGDPLSVGWQVTHIDSGYSIMPACGLTLAQARWAAGQVALFPEMRTITPRRARHIHGSDLHRQMSALFKTARQL